MPDEVVTTRFGRFLVNPEECIGATVKAGTVWDGGGFLQLLAAQYGRLGAPGWTLLDIGAHVGDWAIWCVRQGAWRVVVVEPAPLTLQKLKANLDLNRDVADTAIALLPVAAYDRTAWLDWTVPFVDRDSGGAALRALDATDPPSPTAIPAEPLDSYSFLWDDPRGGVSLIKIDAQGCDGRALRGLAQTIDRWHPPIVFEWEAELATAHGDTLADTIGWLQGHGYQVWEWPSHRHNYLARWEA